MSIEQYLSPIRPDSFGYYPSEYQVNLGNVINCHTPESGLPEIHGGCLVLVGVEEDRGAECNAGCAQAPNEIRRYLYQLAVPVPDTSIVDLGNIIIGQLPEDTYYTLAYVVSRLRLNKCTVIILGGSQDLTFATYKGYEKLGMSVNITSIDPRFDLEKNDDITSRTWLRNIIMQTPNYLFFHSNIGYQTYFVGPEYVTLMDELKFDARRLGEIQHDMPHAEALLRLATIVSVDVGAVRQSDAPGNGAPSPHGLYGEELCQLLRFAGLSDSVSCLGVYEVNPLFDNHGQTAHMVSHAIWYFIEGYYNRHKDNPIDYPESCKHYYCTLEEPEIEVEYYKSKLSERWWVKVPCNDAEKQATFGQHLTLPCTYEDYLNTINEGKLPELWWIYYQRMNGAE